MRSQKLTIEHYQAMQSLIKRRMADVKFSRPYIWHSAGKCLLCDQEIVTLEYAIFRDKHILQHLEENNLLALI